MLIGVSVPFQRPNVSDPDGDYYIEPGKWADLITRMPTESKAGTQVRRYDAARRMTETSEGMLATKSCNQCASAQRDCYVFTHASGKNLASGITCAFCRKSATQRCNAENGVDPVRVIKQEGSEPAADRKRKATASPSAERKVGTRKARRDQSSRPVDHEEEPDRLSPATQALLREVDATADDAESNDEDSTGGDDQVVETVSEDWAIAVLRREVSELRSEVARLTAEEQHSRSVIMTLQSEFTRLQGQVITISTGVAGLQGNQQPPSAFRSLPGP
jgi:hypothetical protein